MNDDFSLSAKRVTYFMTGLNLAVGIINFIMGTYKIDSVQIAGGVISLFAGAILLIGIIKNSTKFLLVYFIIQSVIFTLGTLCGLLLMIVLVTASLQNIDNNNKDDNVKIGKGFVVNRYMAGLIAFVVLVAIIISWIVHFLVYVFYDDVATRNRGAALQRDENTAARYDVISENSDGTNAEGAVKFVDSNGQPYHNSSE